MNIRLSDPAQIELDDAYSYYEEASPSAAIAFLRTIESALSIISFNPTAFPLEYKNIRKFTLRRFPYLIYYRIQGDTIEVFSVFHAKRNPKEWRSKAT